MKQIKFRGKTKSSNKWIYGYFYKFSDNSCWIQEIMSNGSLHAQEVIPETVGQFTGLDDKKKVEIFKGDVVKNSAEEIAQVEYMRTREPRYTAEANSGNILCFTETDIEVIGNIHDNPDLIK